MIFVRIELNAVLVRQIMGMPRKRLRNLMRRSSRMRGQSLLLDDGTYEKSRCMDFWFGQNKRRTFKLPLSSSLSDSEKRRRVFFCRAPSSLSVVRPETQFFVAFHVIKLSTFNQILEFYDLTDTCFPFFPNGS